MTSEDMDVIVGRWNRLVGDIHQRIAREEIERELLHLHPAGEEPLERGGAHCMRTTTSAEAPWAIVLAGGEGRRMAPTVRDWLGAEHRPKQYCAFTGEQTMFEQALDRMTRITAPDRVVSVIGRGHRAYVGTAAPGLLLEQPADCGTAAGVFLPLAHVLANSPDATVLLTPCDQFVHPEVLYLQYATLATLLAEEHPDELVLLGARPDRAETDYGWIELGPTVTLRPTRAQPGCLTVHAFHEKPNAIEARRLFDGGALWNTFVLAAKAKTLWALGRKFLPHVVGRLDMLRQTLHAIHYERCPREHAAVALAHCYQYMPRADFSRDLLQPAVQSLSVLPIEGVRWSDWGQPQRIVESLAAVGQRPAFLATTRVEAEAS